MTGPVRWLWRLWTQIDADVREPRKKLDWRPIVILISVAVSLTLQEYWGDRALFQRLGFISYSDPSFEIWSFVWWAGWRVLGFLILPVVVVLLMPGEKLRDYHWSLPGFTRHIRLYLGLYLAVLPLLLLMAQTKAFRHIYPFYRQANRSPFDFWAWEGLYAAQFLSLEFFFRGFMLRGLAPALGIHAVWVMVVPYCMIHFGKTLPETLAAIFAGLILGTIALRTRSIWGGVLIHIGVAVTMDLLTVGHLKPP